MTNRILHVHTLGDLSLQVGQLRVTDKDNRAKKVWLLLTYLFCHRGQSISQDTICTLLWGDGEGTTNPPNALKTSFHRLRAMLSPLEEALELPLILRDSRGYAWNTAIPMEVDADRFETLCRPVDGESAEDKLSRELTALSLYDGDFLPLMAAEPWCVPMVEHYHGLFLSTLMDALSALEEAGQIDQVATLCRQAVTVEPYQEELYQRWMRALIDLGRQAEAVQVYDDLSQMLYDAFGVFPSEKALLLYREASRDGNETSLSVQDLMGRLKEIDRPGAMLCDFDFFKVLYQSEARRIARNGVAVHVCLFTVVPIKGKTVARRSIERCAANLQELLLASLRRGDSVAKCSLSQFVLMLPQANYESSQMVCQRVCQTFQRQFPHAPVQLKYEIRSLEPTA